MSIDKNYIPYGPEWEKEIKKLPKEVIVTMLRNKGQEVALLKEQINTNSVVITDSMMLNWIEQIITPKDNYCEVFFAGLRSGVNDATEFQIECNPERFDVLQAKSLREVILLAMLKYPKA